MQAILDIAFPIFAIMLAGYLSGLFKILGEASSEALNKFVYFVALPALFFVSLARAPLDEVFYWPFLLAFCGGMFATMLLAIVTAQVFFGGSLATKGMNGISAVFSNTGYMGVPLLLLLYGVEGLLPGIVTTVITGVVLMGLATSIFEIDSTGTENIGRGPRLLTLTGQVIQGVVKSPLLLSAAAGLLVAALDMALPKAVQNFCDILGAAAGPSALFAIGLFMASRPLRRGMAEATWISLLKLVVQPLITWWLAFQVVEMPRIWAEAAVIQASLPTGALVFVIAQRYGIYVERAMAVILISTLLSVITLSATLYLLGFD